MNWCNRNLGLVISDTVMAEQKLDLMENASPEYLQELSYVSERFKGHGYDVRILRYFQGSRQEFQNCLRDLCNSSNHNIVLVLDARRRCKYMVVQPKE